eukprot:5690014-Pyramimonas_sp.AAC.2
MSAAGCGISQTSLELSHLAHHHLYSTSVVKRGAQSVFIRIIEFFSTYIYMNIPCSNRTRGHAPESPTLAPYTLLAL